MKKSKHILCLSLVLLLVLPASHGAQPAADITRENVTRLEIAWTLPHR